MLAMESRKRHNLEEPEPLHPKKRALANAFDSPVHLNGNVSSTPTPTADDEPKDQDSLEQFRKEAIFRRMRHYSRENQRSQVRIAELEHRKTSYEASLAAIEACWSQLIDTIRSISLPDNALPLSEDSHDIFDLSKQVSSDADLLFVEALEKKAEVTRQLIAEFVRMSGTVLSHDEMYEKYQRSQTECSALRSELALARSQLADSASQCDKYYLDLVTAEGRLDRLQSRTVRAVERQASSPAVVVKEEVAVEEVAGKVEGGESSVVEPKTEEDGEPKSDAKEQPSPPIEVFTRNGVTMPTPEGWQQLAEFRESAVLNLRKEITGLQDDIRKMRAEATVMGENMVSNSHVYQAFRTSASQLEVTNRELREKLQDAQKREADLLLNRSQWEEEVTANLERTKEDLRNMLVRRDLENARLREQRDQAAADVHERKQKEHFRRQALQECEALAQSRSERLAALQSEVSRLKALIAAQAGDADLADFLSQEKDENITYVDDLKKRLEESKTRAMALEESLSRCQGENIEVAQHIRREAETREQLAVTKKLLQQYQSIYGESSSLPPEITHLSEQLRLKEEEVTRLRLQETQRAQAEAPLYAELDKLSAAWEQLDRQVKSKVFDLTAAEDRIEKVTLEKAKSENKFYAAMREKDALVAESKNMARVIEKQSKLVEKLTNSEKELNKEIIHLLQEQATRKLMLETWQHNLQEHERMTQVWHARAEEKQFLVSQFNKAFKTREERHELARDELRTANERLLKAELALASSKAKPLTVSQKEAALTKEVENCMKILKCSICHSHMRDTVITKCMHSFCKSCVDDRISTRQRKCPACNLQFAQSEVQPLYFQ